jgi:hypothetical protein
MKKTHVILITALVIGGLVVGLSFSTNPVQRSNRALAAE